MTREFEFIKAPTQRRAELLIVGMGQSESQPAVYRVGKSGDFVLVTNEPEESFQFEPSESFMVSYGMDYQSSPKFKHKTLSSIAVSDADQVLQAMVRVGVIPEGNAILYAASKQPSECTFSGMRIGLQEQARKVGPNGLMIFHFSGHGIRVRSNEWGLAPVDFDYTRDTYLTANILTQWLHEVQCEGEHILFTLDCCYAGGIAKELTSSGDFDPVLGLYVMTACTAYETSLVLGPLGHSIFTFFLSRALYLAKPAPGQLPIRKIFDECYSCSTALSSLIVGYDSSGELKWGTMQPQLRVLNLKSVVMEMTGQGQEQTDSAQVGRFRFVTQLYEPNKTMPSLEDKCIAWLETASNMKDGPLIELERRNLLEGRVLETAMCAMLYSVASIQVACDRYNIENANLFITAFMHVVGTIDLIHHGVEFTEKQFLRGWGFYREVLLNHKANDDGLRRLYQRATRENVPVQLQSNVSHRVRSGGVDHTDSATEVNQVCDLAEDDNIRADQRELLLCI